MITFITGHEDPSKEESAIDWEVLARNPGTLVFLMGVKKYDITNPYAPELAGYVDSFFVSYNIKEDGNYIYATLVNDNLLKVIDSQVVQSGAGRQGAFGEGARRLRKEDLAAVAHCGDTRGAVHVQTHVPAGGDDGLSGVETDPHPDRRSVGPAMGDDGPLRIDGRGYRRGGAVEGDEERVALGIDFASSVRLEGAP